MPEELTRNEGSAFPQTLANISVQGNVVKLSGNVYTGMVAESLPSNVTFTGNTYYMVCPAVEASSIWMRALGRAGRPRARTQADSSSSGRLVWHSGKGSVIAVAQWSR